MENHFSIDRDTAIKLARKVQKKHRNYIRAYMVEWFNIGRSGQRDKFMKPAQAIKELKARGFIHMSKANLDKTKPYIRGNVGNLVYPIQPSLPGKNFGGAYELLPKVGVVGYTGITLPVKFLDKKSYRIHKANY